LYQAFAERARIELGATAEHASKGTVDTIGDLTPIQAAGREGSSDLLPSGEGSQREGI
jgi:hypothetical protein